MSEGRVLWGAGMEQFEDGPRFLKVEIIDGGRAIGILFEEANGTVSSVRLGIEQLAD